jgi:cellulose synthase/poly-beta-1,6-N-acetylglucosamine synthase-like glycosyltransferase
MKNNIGILIPTYKRDKQIIKRAISSAISQRNFIDLNEYILNIFICSDTEKKEEHVEEAIKECYQNSFDNKFIYSDDDKFTMDSQIITYYETLGYHSNNYANDPRNKLIQMASKNNMDYVVFLDDDNILFPEYIDESLKVLLEEDVDFTISQILHLGPVNKELLGEPPLILTGEQVKLQHIDTLQFFLKMHVMEEHGWNKEEGYLADGYTFESIGEKYKYAYTNKLLAIHI